MANGASTAMASHSVARLNMRTKNAMSVRNMVVNLWSMLSTDFFGAPDS